MKTSKLLAFAIAGLLLCALETQADITTGLVGYWNLADGPGSSTAADSSGSNNLGTLTGFSDNTYTNMWTTNSDPANLWPHALLFNQGAETTDYVLVPDSTSLDTIPVTKAFTLSAWVNLSALTNSPGVIICKGTLGGESWWMGVTANSKFQAFMRNSSGNSTQTATSGNTVNTGTWYHVAATYHTPGTPHVILYINGLHAADSGAATLTTIHATPVPASIGNYTNASAPFPGTIDEVRVYNRQLSDSDVAQLYTNGPGNIILPIQPYFVQEPTNVIIARGSNMVDSTVAGGSTPLSYQWFDVNAGNMPIAGQTNATLVVSNITASDSYYLTVSNFYGSTNSSTVTAYVYAAPLIISYSPITYTNPFTLYAGASPKFSVTAVAFQPFYYEWFTNGVAAGGATNASLTLSNVSVGFFTNYCVVSNFVGSTTSVVWTAAVIADPTNPTNGLAPYPQSVLAANPIGYWRLNEPDDGNGSSGYSDGNPGVIAHDYWGGNNGIYTNTGLGGYYGFLSAPAPYSMDDTNTTPAGFGLAFANCDAYGISGIDFGAPTNTSATFSIEAWVNGYTPTLDSGIVGKGYNGGEQFDLDTGSDGGSPSHAFRFVVQSASGTVYSANSGIVPSPGTWHHLVGVCDEANSNVSLYVDGQLAGTANIAPGSGILASPYPMVIGSRSSSLAAITTNTYNDQFVGFVGDVAIYNYALSASQVAAHYFSAAIAAYFTRQPPASVTVDDGATLVVPAAANGTPPLGYQWYFYPSGNPMAGQTNQMLVISNVDSGTYNGANVYVTVTNAYGSTNSSFVTIEVDSGAPQITANVPASLVLYAGRTQTYSIAAQGTEPFYYQWYQNGVAISPATNSAYAAIAQLSVTNAYYCTASNIYGGGSIMFSPTGTLAGLSAPANLYPLTVLSNNPVAYWRLDETNGNVAYDFAGGHDCYYTNVQQGVLGYSALDSDFAAQFGLLSLSNSYVGELDLSGSGESNIDFSQPSGGNAEFSVEAWVNLPPFPPGGGGIVAKGYGNGGEQFVLDLGGGGNSFRFVVRNAAGTAANANSTVPSDGKWHHVVGVCDEANGNLWLYVDGLAVANAAFTAGSGVQPGGTGSAGLGDNRVTMGARTSGSGAASFNTQTIGTIDEVALYNYALSSSQAMAHYLAGYVAPPGALTITNMLNGQLQVSWAGVGTLQDATNVAGPYNDISGAASPYTVSITNAQMFYRVKQQ